MADGDPQNNPLTLSDAQMLDQIFETHVDADSEIDVDSLFNLVQNILKASTHLVDNVLQGSQSSLENYHAKSLQPSFDPPLHTLKQIFSEMSCKPPVIEIAHKTTLTILHKLSNYSWQAKAMLPLAAFALDYGDFNMLSQYPSDITELNNLIKASLQVIEIIFELEKLSSQHIEDIPSLAPSLDQIPVGVYWTITTIVVCVAQINCLTTKSERQDLSHFGQKINAILIKLRRQAFSCGQEKEAVEYYKTLCELYQTPGRKITDVLKMLIFWKDAPQKSIYDGTTKRLVSIDVLNEKEAFLFISNLDITEEEIDTMRQIHEKLNSFDKKKLFGNPNIVWIPMVEEWTEPLKERFEILKSKMPLFVVQYFGTMPGFRYIKEQCHFEKEPMLASMKLSGNIIRSSPLQKIQQYGSFRDIYLGLFFEPRISLAHLPSHPYIQKYSKGAGSWVRDIYPDRSTLNTEGKYIFIYGGKDKKWLGEFRKYVTALQQDPILEEANISIEPFCIEWHKNFRNRFWTRLEELFQEGIQEVQKTLSYKNETSWALLIDNSTLILESDGTAILKTVKEFEKWREDVIRKGFEITFKEQHRKVAENSRK